MTDGPKHVLLVEDEDALRSTIALRLTAEGFVVDEAADGDTAIQRLSSFAYDALVTDLRMPGADGTQVLDAGLERYPDLAAIVVTGYGTVKDAVDAIRRGASDFITKPFQFDELRHVLRTALERRELRAENRYLREQLEARYGLDGLVGRSAPMRELSSLLATVAPTNSTILITGETGTGKELVARAIHVASLRSQHRFIALNCSAIPETLLEAELFGHVRGAFTGAVAQRQGRFEQAHRGTLFLDEVGTMSPALQAKLLRVLQARAFERVGDSQTIRVDVRVIAATNSDLARMVREGSFREDLYYRLNVIQVKLPPLRDRREDIPLLVQHFLDRLGREHVPQRMGVTFTQEALRRLMAHDWPGNVRQLENIVERAFTLSPGRRQIDVAALPPDLVPPTAPDPEVPVMLPDSGLDLEAVLTRMERALIHQALERTAGNKRQAADLLRIKRTTLVEKLKRLGNGGPVAAGPGG
jgi:two-component system response regulator PilR (NtrC family)